MINLHKFNARYPKNKEEALIVELINRLTMVTIDFIKENIGKEGFDRQMFLIIRDASIGYSSYWIRELSKMLHEKDQIGPFLDESKNIFNLNIFHDK